VLDPTQQDFQKGLYMPLAAGAATFAPLLDLVPQAGQFAFQGLYFTGLAGVAVAFAQFELETLEFLAQPV
jgi:hypothetical protein